MRASGVMVSDLQNPARVWPVCHAVLCCAAALVSAGSQPLASDTAGSTGRSGRDNATFVSSLNCQEVSPKDTRRYSKENLFPSQNYKLSPRKPAGSRESGAVKFARGGAARLVTISAGRGSFKHSLPARTHLSLSCTINKCLVCRGGEKEKEKEENIPRRKISGQLAERQLPAPPGHTSHYHALSTTSFS